MVLLDVLAASLSLYSGGRQIGGQGRIGGAAAAGGASSYGGQRWVELVAPPDVKVQPSGRWLHFTNRCGYSHGLLVCVWKY